MTSPVPLGRRAHVMWLDIKADRLVVYGGKPNVMADVLGDIWEFDMGN